MSLDQMSLSRQYSEQQAWFEECGHCVAAWVCGMTVDHLGLASILIDTSADPLKNAIVAFAGAEARRLFGDDPTATPSAADWETIAHDFVDVKSTRQTTRELLVAEHQAFFCLHRAHAAAAPISQSGLAAITSRPGPLQKFGYLYRSESPAAKAPARRVTTHRGMNRDDLHDLIGQVATAIGLNRGQSRIRTVSPACGIF